MPFTKPFSAGDPSKHIFHILNGDALSEQFPADIPGQRIVAREALADGLIQGSTPEQFFAGRLTYMQEKYGISAEEYTRLSIGEFQKIQCIPPDAFVFLWFEDDVFCQLNCWFVAFLLAYEHHRGPCYLIRPQEHSHLGFGGLSREDLLALYREKAQLVDVNKLSELWKTVQTGKAAAALDHAREALQAYPFIATAVGAYFEALPGANDPGRPKRSLICIVKELGTTDFRKVFAEFNKREAIYGYGDLQVQRLLQELVESGLV